MTERFEAKYKEESWDIPLEEFKWRIMRSWDGDNGAEAVYAAYPDARTVSRHLDRLFTPMGWEDSYEVSPNGKAVTCTLRIRMDGEWISKMDVGNVSDIEPIKGGFSDAFKRAAAKWGVGRNAYDIPELKGPAFTDRNGKHRKPFEVKGTPIDEWLVERAYKALQQEAKGEAQVSRPDPDSDQPSTEDVPQEESEDSVEQQKVWKQFMETMKALSEDKREKVKQWWLDNGDGTSKPSSDTELEALKKVSQFATTIYMEEEMGAKEVEPSEGEPF